MYIQWAINISVWILIFVILGNVFSETMHIIFPTCVLPVRDDWTWQLQGVNFFLSLLLLLDTLQLFKETKTKRLTQVLRVHTHARTLTYWRSHPPTVSRDKVRICVEYTRTSNSVVLHWYGPRSPGITSNTLGNKLTQTRKHAQISAQS